jgi:hypothetical protein
MELLVSQINEDKTHFSDMIELYRYQERAYPKCELIN